MNIIRIFIPVVPAVVSALIAGFYLTYFADILAKQMGYFIALAIVPFFAGVVIGSGFMSIPVVGKRYSSSAKFIFVPVSAGIAAYVPILYTLIIMSV